MSILQSAVDVINDMLRGINCTTALVLGSGFHAVLSNADVVATVGYSHIPGWKCCTAAGHRGELAIVQFNNASILVLNGRQHSYEGYTLQECTFPIRTLAALGVRNLILTGAVGGLHPAYHAGDVVIADDYINLMGDSPLVGTEPRQGQTRFVDMIEPFCTDFIAFAENSATQLQHNLHRGVYVAVKGPNLETRAEYRYMRMIGGDIVGMSTVPETIVANQLQMKVLSLSVVTDECDPDHLMPLSYTSVKHALQKGVPVVDSIVRSVLELLHPE